MTGNLGQFTITYYQGPEARRTSAKCTSAAARFLTNEDDRGNGDNDDDDDDDRKPLVSRDEETLHFWTKTKTPLETLDDDFDAGSSFAAFRLCTSAILRAHFEYLNFD